MVESLLLLYVVLVVFSFCDCMYLHVTFRFFVLVGSGAYIRVGCTGKIKPNSE